MAVTRWRSPDYTGRVHVTVRGRARASSALCGYPIPEDWVRTTVVVSTCESCKAALVVWEKLVARRKPKEERMTKRRRG